MTATRPALEPATRGFTTIQYVIAVAWSLVLFVLVANLMVDLYARGAVRDALDDGVRAGAPAAGPVAACEARAHEVVSGLVRGPLLDARGALRRVRAVRRGRGEGLVAVVAADARSRLAHDAARRGTA